MISFYIDTTSNFLYSGIVKDNELLVERKLSLNHDLSSFTLDEVSKMFDEINMDVSCIDRIFVVNGPGSFTGIRIGVTIAKTIAFCLKKKIISISSLEAMACSVDGSGKLVVPIINARRSACYGAIYNNGKVILEEQYMLVDKLKLILSGLGEKYVFVSNDEFLDLEVINYNPNILKIVLTYQNRKPINAHLVNPKYLKLTEAEENNKKEEV